MLSGRSLSQPWVPVQLSFPILTDIWTLMSHGLLVRLQRTNPWLRDSSQYPPLVFRPFFFFTKYFAAIRNFFVAYCSTEASLAGFQVGGTIP